MCSAVPNTIYPIYAYGICLKKAYCLSKESNLVFFFSKRLEYIQYILMA